MHANQQVGPRRAGAPKGSVADRLSAVAAAAPCAELARRAGLSVETARRQLRRGTPSPMLIAAICEALDVSPDWLLTGRGPRRYSAVGAYWLRRADSLDLCAEVNHRMQGSAPGPLCEIKSGGSPGAEAPCTRPAEVPPLRLRRPPPG